jgi:transketolase
MMTDEREKFIAERAHAIRESIIEMLVAAGSGHTAGALGMADVFALLYFHALKHNPQQPEWSERDLLVLSNGHICPVQYAAMAHAGYFPVEELMTLRKFGSRLQGHPHREFLPGIEVSSGPLGSGFAQAVGMALSLRMSEGMGTRRYVYALTGDGELDCGIVWEAAMFAGKERLQNVIVIVDRNGIQIDGYTWEVMPLEPLREKWESFGWHVQEVDGHNIRALDAAIGEAKSVDTKPSVIIAHTIPGKGVKEFERDYHWHGKPPSKEEGAHALEELERESGASTCAV